MSLQPIDFKITTAGRLLAEQVGILLSDKLGKLTVPAFNYYPINSVVVSGDTYTITLDVRELATNIVTQRVVSVVATNTSVVDLLTAFKVEVDTNFSEELHVNINTNYNNDVDMHMFIVPKVGYSSVEVSKVGMASDPKEGYTQTDQPASYLAMGKQPSCEFPRIIVTTGVQNVTAPSNSYGSGTVEEDGNFYPYTDKYVTYSINLTCEAGDIDSSLERGEGAQDILQDLVKRLGSRANKDRLQQAMNSSLKTSTNVLPSPAVEFTEYMDIASMSMRFDVLDRYVDRFNGEGYIQYVQLKGGSPVDKGIEYRMGEDDPIVRKYGDSLLINRGDSL